MANLPPIRIVRSKRKTLAFHFTHAGLTILAPLHLSMQTIKAFIAEKTPWIEQKTRQLHPQPRHHYMQGETFLYVGNEYTLDIGTYKQIAIQDTHLLFPQFLAFRIEKELTLWYIHQAQDLITKRVAFYARQMNTSYLSVTFSDTKSRWGACSHDNRLQFNWHLILAPLAVIDYVVVHELSHTKEKNHTWKFWSTVRFVLPAYKQRRKWLQTNGVTLRLSY